MLRHLLPDTRYRVPPSLPLEEDAAVTDISTQKFLIETFAVRNISEPCHLAVTDQGRVAKVVELETLNKRECGGVRYSIRMFEKLFFRSTCALAIHP